MISHIKGSDPFLVLAAALVCLVSCSGSGGDGGCPCSWGYVCQDGSCVKGEPGRACPCGRGFYCDHGGCARLDDGATGSLRISLAPADVGKDPVYYLTAGLETPPVSAGQSSIPLHFAKLMRFRLRIYRFPPLSESEEPLFDSRDHCGCCDSAEQDPLRVDALEAGDNLFIYYQGYSDPNCEQLEGIGVRGGVTVLPTSKLDEKAAATACSSDTDCTDKVHPDAKCNCEKAIGIDGKALPVCLPDQYGLCAVSPPTYVPLYVAGEFTEFIEPASSLRSGASAIPCTTDKECMLGVHSASTCALDEGVCRMTGFPPFTLDCPRAFHTATELPDGRIAIAGGLTRQGGGNHFNAGQANLVALDPASVLFSRLKVPTPDTRSGVALHSTAVMGEELLVQTGGVTLTSWQFEADEGGTSLRLTVPLELAAMDGTTTPNISRSAFITDLQAMALFEGALPGGILGHTSIPVASGDTSLLLVAGGLFQQPGGSLALAEHFPLCDPTLVSASEIVPLCDAVSLAPTSPRAFHNDRCLVDSGPGEPCDSYLLLGGTESAGSAAELVTQGAQGPAIGPLPFLEGNAPDATMLSAFIPVDPDEAPLRHFFSFGGITSAAMSWEQDGDSLTLRFGRADAPVRRLEFSAGESTAVVSDVHLGSLDPPEKASRIFHTVSRLSDGRIMVAGGLGEGAVPTRSALFFSPAPGGALTFLEELEMKSARFGHTATTIATGPLKGAVVLLGGMTVDSTTGKIELAGTGEVLVTQDWE